LGSSGDVPFGANPQLFHERRRAGFIEWGVGSKFKVNVRLAEGSRSDGNLRALRIQVDALSGDLPIRIRIVNLRVGPLLLRERQ
jgi:hypothetical protein